MRKPRPAPIQRLLTIKQAQQVSGFSRSRIYVHLSEGKYKAVKEGARTMIVEDTLKEYMTNLPVATFGGGCVPAVKRDRERTCDA